MATFTVTTGTSSSPADYATLGTRATADVYNINGGYLRVDIDSRYGIGGAAAASFGNIVPSATLAGSIEFNSTKVRLIPFDTGATLTNLAYAQTFNANTSAYADVTTPISEATANDVNAPPYQVTTAGDALYFGCSTKFARLSVNTGTAKSVTGGVYAWQYWNGAWTALSGLSDGTAFFQTTGAQNVTFTAAADWVTNAVNGQTYYWVRAVATTNPSVITTAGKVTQAWQQASYIPAADSTISKGSASGKLIGVYTATNVAPSTALTATPASGYIKIRQWNSTSYTTGALTGIGANATAADGPGWIECVGVDASIATINRLNSFIVRGDWYTFLDTTTTGTRTTGYQIPSNGSGVNYFPGVWVSTAADKTITGATWGNSAAVYTSASHGFVAGQLVTVSGVTPTGYNVVDVKIASVTTNTFTIPLTSDPGSWSSGGLAYAFECYPCLGTLATTITNMATDAVRGKYCWVVPASGLVYFGYDATNQTGAYVPPSGRRLRIPNIFFVCCVAAATVNVLPNATLATRYRFSTTAAGVIDIDKCSMNWNANFQQPFSVALTNTAIMTQLMVQEIAAPIAWSHVAVGQEAANTQNALSMILCTAGGTQAYCTWTRASAITTSTHILTDVSGLTITYEKTCNLLLRTGAATTHVMTRVGNCTWTNTILGNGVVSMSTCNDITFTTTTFYSDPGGALQQTTGTAQPLYVWSCLLSCVRIKMDGLDFGGLRMVQPYSGVLNIGLAGNSAIKLRNLGTYASPLDMGDAQVDATYTRSTTTATATKTAHGLKINDIFYCITSDSVAAITVGTKTVASVTDVNIFTFACLNGGASSGSITYYPTMTAQLVNIVSAHDGGDFKIQRCYTPHLRTNLIVVGDNSNKNLLLESVVGDYINAPTSITLNQKYKQLTCTHPLAAQNSVYGTHWLDYFTTGMPASTSGVAWTRSTTTATITSTAHGLRTNDLINVTVTSDAAAIVLGQKTITTLTSSTFTFTCLNGGGASGTLTFKPLHGRIGLTMNETTSDTTSQVTLTNGSAFTSAGTLYMPTIGHQADFTSSDNLIGHTAFPIAEAVMAGGTISNHDTTYSLDGGVTYKNLYYPRFVTPLTATSGTSTYPYIVKMSATQSLAIFAPASTFVNASVITISGGLVTMDTPLVLNAAASTYLTVCRLTDTTAMVCWVAAAAIQSMVLTISGTIITASASQLVYTGASTYLSVVRMTNTQALLTWANSSTFLSAVALDLSGSGTATVITVGTIKVVNGVATTYIATAPISATQAVCVMRDTSTFAKTYVLTVTTGTPSTVANGTISAASGAAAVSYCAITAISATKVIITYRGVSSFIEAVVGTVTGTDCAFGTVKPLNGTVSTFCAIDALSSTTAMVTFIASNTFLSAIHLTESAAVITIGALATINTVAVASNYSVAALSSTLAISTYIGTSSFVQIRLLNVSGTTVSAIADSTTGGNTIDIANGASQLVAGDYVWGTGIAPNAKISSIASNVATLDTVHTALVTGQVRFNHLPTETVADASVGFPLKLRILTSTTNAAAITSLYFFTTSTSTSRGYTYPLDVTVVSVVLQNVVVDSTYRIEKQSDGAMVFQGTAAAPTITNSYTHIGTDLPVKIIVRKESGVVKYLPFEILGTITNTGLTTYVSQVADTTAAAVSSVPIGDDWTIDYTNKRIYHVQYKDVINGADASVAEVTDVTVLATAGISAGDYFNLYSAKDATAYYVWYQIDSAGANPVPAGKTAILVDIATGDANTVVATKTRDAINTLADPDFTATASSAIVTITNDAKGSTTDASDSTGGTITGFTFAVTTPGRGKTIWPVNALYTWVQDQFDATGSLDDLVPMSAQTPTEYSLINGWFIDEESIKFLNGGALQTSGWNAVIQQLVLDGSYTPVVAGDIGNQVKDDAANVGALLFADNTRQRWWFRSAATVADNSVMTIDTGAGAGTAAGASVTGENIWSNIFTLGSLVAGTTLDAYRNDVQITPWWSSGQIDVLIRVKEGGTETDSGNVTILARKYSTLYDHFLIDASTGRNPVPLAAFTDGNNQTASGTVAGYTGITFSFGAKSRDLGNGNGLKPYDVEIDCGTRVLSQVYEYLKYVTRTGSSDTLNGVNGEFYTAVGDIRVNYTGEASGPFVETNAITSSTGGSGYIVSLIDNGTTGTLVIRNVHGTFASTNTLTSSGTTGTISGTPDTITASKQAPFGTFAGGKFFGARGVYIMNMATADANNYSLIDSTNTAQTPPSRVTVAVNGLVSGDRVSVFRTTGDNEIIDRAYLLSHATANTSGSTTFTTTATIPADTPASGVIRVVDNTTRTEQRYSYSSFSGTVFSGIVKLFSPDTAGLDRTYITGDAAYVPYIDEQAAGTSISKSVTYAADRFVLTRVRLKGIQPFTTKGTLTSSGYSATAVRTTDSIA